VLDKGIELLEIPAQHGEGVGLAELSRLINLPKSSVFRYLATFEARGYVERVPGADRFRLGIKLFELGNRVLSRLDVRELSLPVMEKLRDMFQETVNLGVLDRAEVVYLEIYESSQSIRMAAKPGRRDSAHSTALGKSMLAHLPEAEVNAILRLSKLSAHTSHTITTMAALQSELKNVRQRGYATDSGENEQGVRCVGAPILDHAGHPAAAISISGPANRMPAAIVDTMGKELVKQTRGLSQRLGYTQSFENMKASPG
jgi:DNA-binding IclR family transcriptional regulator